MKNLSLIITLLIVVSCSGAQIKSASKIPISFDDLEEHSKEISIDTKVDYFLWGLVPKDYSINLDELFVRDGYTSVANVALNQHLTFSDALFSILTLGFYLPQTITIKGKINPYRLNQL